MPGFVCRQPQRQGDRSWITWLGSRGHDESFLADSHKVAPAPEGGVSLAMPGDVPAPIPPGADPHPPLRMMRERTLATALQPGLSGSVADLRPADIARIRALHYG